MYENKTHRNGYKLIKVTENKYQLCKILNEYNTKADADNDLLDLLTKNKTEKELLKEFNKKDIF